MKKIIIEDVFFWMDGGTMTLKIKKEESILYEVEFVQKMSLERGKREIENKPIPGSLLLNRKEVEIRSELETEILSEIKAAEFGIKIAEKERDSLREIISEAIKFVESEDYVSVAKRVGRIK
ncbi:MAG: hypothetical protein ABIP27_02450 [Flavobacterium circumlabens]|uniref:hypothetical protein n=1 Tax=Flavobacterium circumlabens TaxID=2133765 RepID=UPI0032634807